MNNGRINLEGPDIKHQFEMFDKIPVESYSFHDAMTGNFYKTELSNLFFSSKNNFRFLDTLSSFFFHFSPCTI